PIVLDSLGATLIGILGKKINDDVELTFMDYVGVHDGCGDFRLFSHSEKHHRMVCCDCGLAIIFPKKHNTYGKLRQWCAKNNEAEKLRQDLICSILSKESLNLSNLQKLSGQ